MPPAAWVGTTHTTTEKHLRTTRGDTLERFQSSCSGLEEPEVLTTTSATGGGRYETIENTLYAPGRTLPGARSFRIRWER